MAHVVITFNAADLDPVSLRTVLSRQILYDRTQQRRARTTRACAVAASLALACWRSGLWPLASLVAVILPFMACGAAYAAEWRARRQLDTILDTVPATRTVLPQTGSPPRVP